jgi:hypothetical protein
VATHDYSLANQDGASFRSDLNNALAAIVSNNSSSTAPASTFAHQIWVDTTANVIKQRNAANDAWIELWRIDGGFNAKTFSSNVTLNAQSDLRFADSDSSNWVAFQAPATVASNVTWTLPSADGTADQALVTNGSGTLSWADSGGGDNITEGNTSAEVVDTGSDGHFKVVTEGTEALRVDSSRRLLIGTDTNRTGFSLQLEGTNYNQASLSLTNNQNTGNSGYIYLTKTRGTAVGSNTIVNNGDPLGIIEFSGADGSALQAAAKIEARVDGTPGTNDMPGRLVFYTTADGSVSPTERVRLDNYGRLLAGTTAPSGIGIYGSLAKHMFVTAGASIDQGVVLEAPTGYGNNLTFRASQGSVGSNSLVTNGKSLGAINWFGTDGTYAQRAVTIDGFVDTTPGASDMPGSLQIAICDNNTTDVKPRFRIYHNGELNTYSNDNCIMIHSVDAGGTTYNYLFGRRSSGGFGSGTNTFAVRTNGNVVNTNNSYGSLSDVKLKENIVDSGSQWDDVKALRIRKYNFKADTGQDTHTQLGVIAQEVELVSPGLVYETSDTESINAPVLDEDGNPVLDANNEPTYRTQEHELGTVTKNVNYSVLYMKAVKALQEAMTRIEALETANASLEARLTALENA